MSDNDLKRPAEEEEQQGNGDAKKAKASYKGVVLFMGATDWADVGRKGSTNLSRSPHTLWKPTRLAALADLDVTSVHSGPNSCHLVAVTAEGAAYVWGRNEKCQLGLGHEKDRRCPTKVGGQLEGKKVVSAATGRNHTLFLTEDGEVYACGDNRSGQAGGGAKTTTVKEPIIVPYEGAPAVRVACGAEFSALVDSNGVIYTWGHPEHGQLGHNTEGSFLEKAGKVNFDYVYSPTRVSVFMDKDPKSKQSVPVLNVNVKEISCGSNHCVCIDDRNRAFSWGFGGYGRLGHSETGNELVPRMIKFFDGPKRGITKVTAGGQFNLAVAEMAGTTYMWGQYNTTKEANMYPKPIADLSGWIDVRSIGCSMKGWMVAADDSVVGAVPSPCFGELGMGENKKSSAAPIEIKGLQDINVVQSAMGVAHTVLLVKPTSDAIKTKAEAFPEVDQASLDA